MELLYFEFEEKGSEEKDEQNVERDSAIYHYLSLSWRWCHRADVSGFLQKKEKVCGQTQKESALQ